MKANSIYCGDCFNILQKFPRESIDLIYIDPPFFTQEYYEDPFGNGSAIKAFQDKWYDKNGSRGNIDCYLEYMEPRIEQMYQVLKPTGSFYLHCDWHANAYLRTSLDEIFGKNNFRNEIIWHYFMGGKSKKQFARKHDTLFFYSKGNTWTFNSQKYKRRLDYIPTLPARSSSGKPVEDTTGKDEIGWYSIVTMDDVWDISGVFNLSHEYQGYPTQKPVALLERIIKASSNPTDIVLDPMCGCGTTIVVAHKLGRQWIGIDVSPTACRLMVKRLRSLKCTINDADICNLPRPIDELETMDWFEFQKWCVESPPFYGRSSSKKGIDMGIDGYTFDGTPIQVKQNPKGPKVGRNVLYNFETAIRNKGKTKGIIIAFSFTRTAKDEAARAKRDSGLELQLVTVKQLLPKIEEALVQQKKGVIA